MGAVCSAHVPEPVKPRRSIINPSLYECGAVVAFGSNAAWQLGIAGNTELQQALRVSFSSVPLHPHRLLEDDVAHISVGAAHAALICDAGTVYTWGDGRDGRLAHGYDRSEPVPRAVSHLLGVHMKEVTCGGDFTLFLTNTGQVYSCGCGREGQLGIGAFIDHVALPVLVQDLAERTIVAIGAGPHGTGAAVDSDGVAWTWGQGKDGQLGNGSKRASNRPVAVAELRDAGRKVIRVACGGSHMCAVTDAHRLFVWGQGKAGQLGLGRFTKFASPVPVLVDVLVNERVVSVSCGEFHTAAVTVNGQLWCWGANDFGQVGMGDYQERPLPTRIPLPTAAVSVSCGAAFTTVLLLSGHIVGFGRNDSGQLGRHPLYAGVRGYTFDSLLC